MRDLKVHWKGYPQYRLPRIQLASNSLTSSYNRTLAHDAAKQVIVRPFSAALIQARLKRKSRNCRRRLRSSRSSSSAARAREQICAKSSLMDSHDGAAPSVAREAKTDSDINFCHSEEIVDVPTYWMPTRDDRKGPWRSLLRGDTLPASHTFKASRVGPSGAAIGHRNYYTPDQIGENRISYPKSDSTVEGQQITALVTNEQHMSLGLAQERQSQAGEKLSKPAKASPSHSKGSLVSAESTISVIQSILSNTPSRTPSQRKALQQFTKGLELHIQATECLPKKLLIPSPSATTVSAKTVKELEPYQAEFQAAGLAVTSEEQRQKKASMVRLKQPLLHIPPPKDYKWLTKTSLDEIGEVPDSSNIDQRAGSLSSPGTTLIDWNPPHEMATQNQGVHRSSYTNSSDHTVIDFTPVHEMGKNELQSPALNAPTKKSLPWLRRPKISQGVSPTFTVETNASTTPTKTMLSSRTTVNSFLIMNIPSTPEEESYIHIGEPTIPYYALGYSTRFLKNLASYH